MEEQPPPAQETHPREAGEEDPPALLEPVEEIGVPTVSIAEDMKPSKSALIQRTTSTVSRQMSHVRLQEPGEEQPVADGEKRKSKEEEPTKSEAEGKKSEVERRVSGDKKLSDADGKKIRQQSAVSVGHRLSTTGSQRHSGDTEMSKEGILRRRSDRPSKARSAVGSTISIRRTSAFGEYFGGVKVPKFMNTYKLESENPFQVEKVEKILREVLTEALDNLTYDPDKIPKQAKWASSAIRAKVKEHEYDRYKLICLVTIGEKRYQDMCSVVRFLWDIDRDKYAFFVHENMHVYAAAMCFGLYYE